jgi:methionine-rich copper-binding protein CopC
MKMRTVLSVLLVILFATTMGCATMESAGHKYVMRGSVLDVSDGTAYVCLGTEQGAKVGQEFMVFRYVKTAANPKTQQPQYRVETVGRVKITATESHMAHAKILNGDVKENDVVELSP